jgi:hypothetical protein
MKSAQLVNAKVVGYSSFQKLDRIDGDCSAFRKNCAAKVEYKLSDDGQLVEALVSQPLFARTQTDQLKLFVSASDITNPRIASVHVLFRNATCTIFLGLVCLLLSWVLRKPTANRTLA